MALLLLTSSILHTMNIAPFCYPQSACFCTVISLKRPFVLGPRLCTLNVVLLCHPSLSITVSCYFPSLSRKSLDPRLYTRNKITTLLPSQLLLLCSTSLPRKRIVNFGRYTGSGIPSTLIYHFTNGKQIKFAFLINNIILFYTKFEIFA